MTLKEFIEKFVCPNTLIRLWEPTKEGHRMITETPVMEWELLQEKTVYSILLSNTVIGVTDILTNDNYPEAVNIVLHNTVDMKHPIFDLNKVGELTYEPTVKVDEEVYVVLSINGDIIGISTSPQKAVDIYKERYASIEIPDETIDDFDYLKSIHRIRTFQLDKYYG